MAIGTDIIFADNFNRADGPLGAGWTQGGPSGSEFSIAANAVKLSQPANTPGPKYMLVADPAIDGADAAIQFRTDYGTRSGAFFRMSGGGTNISGYGVVRGGANYVFERWNNGVRTELQAAWIGVAWLNGTLTAECETVDGNVVLRFKSTTNSTVRTFTDSSAERILEAGGVGLICEDASSSTSMFFDDFVLLGTAGGGGGPDPEDEEAPELTGAYFTATGVGNTAEVGVTTNEGNGILRAVMTNSVTKPLPEQIEAGQDHTGSAALRALSGPVTAPGEISLEVLVPFGTGRYMHLCHTDAAGNASEVVSAGPFGTLYREVFFDDFNRANSSTLGANWENLYGAPAVASGQARRGSLDEFQYSAALLSMSALAEVPNRYSVEVDTSAVIDPNDEDSVMVIFGMEPGNAVFTGLAVFFAGDYVALWWYDDVTEEYFTLDTSALTPQQALSRYRIDIVFDGSLSLHIYSLQDNALLMDAAIPSGQVPAYLTELRPGLGFLDHNSSGVLWADNFGVYAELPPEPEAPRYARPVPLFFGTNF